MWIERVGRTYVDRIRWTPHVESYAIRVETRVTGDPVDDLAIEVTLRHGQRLLARDRYQVMDHEADRFIVLADPGIDDFRNELLWSPERPTLLEANVRLLADGDVIDEFSSYTALRSVSILRDRFMLNGRPYLLRMVLDQGYWPDTLMAAPSDAALRKDVELAKAMGFNGVRKHQKIEDPRYLYWADRLGLMVWEEMPSAYRFTRTAIKRTIREWSEAIERDYSHPCVVAWIPFNESWGVPELTAHAVAAPCRRGALPPHQDARRDPARDRQRRLGEQRDRHHRHPRLRRQHRAPAPALWPEIKTEQLFDRRRPGRPRAHARRLPAPRPADHADRIRWHRPYRGRRATAGGTWGYSSARDGDELTQMFERLLETVVHTALFSGFCYTQFADTFQEANGLLRADRTPKIPLARIARVHDGVANAHPGRRLANMHEDARARQAGRPRPDALRTAPLSAGRGRAESLPRAARPARRTCAGIRCAASG